MIELESPDCPLCGCGTGISLPVGKGFSPYGLRACPGCGLHFLSPRLTEGAIRTRYATDGYFNGDGYADYGRQEAGLRATFRRLLQTLQRRGHAGGALLEVGCGYGYLLDEARPFFSRRVGTDLSPAAVHQAAARADAAWCGGVDAVPADAGPFDCVIATHVVEHVYDPHAFTRALAARLRPGGTLVLAAPDAGSYWCRWMGARWPSYKLPEHVLYFDRRTLARLMRDSGLERTLEIPYPHAFPLPLIASKLGLRLPSAFDRFNFWLPATTVAICGVKPDA